MRSSIVVASLLALAQTALAAQPPACVLGVIATYDDPSDIKGFCEKQEKEITDALADFCKGDDLKAGYDAIKSQCKEAGVTIAKLPSSQDDDDKDGQECSSVSVYASSTGDADSAKSTDSSTTEEENDNGDDESGDSDNGAISHAPSLMVLAMGAMAVTLW